MSDAPPERAGDQTALWSPPEPAAGGSELLSGQLLAGRFRLVRFLGRGGMGDVYEAEDLELGRRVALKTVRPEIARLPGVIDRFRREIQLALEVTHENVCRLFDVFHHRGEGAAGDEITFYTMELLAGETLQQRLLRAGPLSESEALPIVRQMIAGLAAAHRAGIVHRDFKGANVMLVPEAVGVRAVVTDFGLARGGQAGGGGLTVKGDFLGTPDYMAPEQVTGGEITAATDVYALGIVLYEMVTGALPFTGDSVLSIATRRLQERPPSPRLAVPALAVAWEAVILRCMEREPAARFASVTAVAAALDPDAPSGSAHPRARWARSRAAKILLALAVAVGVLAAARWLVQAEAGRLKEAALSLAGEGKFDKAIPRLRRAASLLAWVADRRGETQARGSLGLAIGMQGDIKSGLRLIEEALKDFESTKNHAGQATQLINLGTLYQEIPDPDRTRSSFERALSQAEAAEDESLLALASYDLGTVRYTQGDLQDAYAKLRQALRLQTKLGEDRDALDSRIYLGEALFELGRLDEAAPFARDAAKAALASGNRASEAEAGALLARIRLAQSDLRAARSELDGVERIAQTSQDNWTRGLVALAAGPILAAEGRAPDAIRRLEAALVESKGDATLEPHLRLALGEVQNRYGDRDRGRQLLAEVGAYARQNGMGLLARKSQKALAASPP